MSSAARVSATTSRSANARATASANWPEAPVIMTRDMLTP